MVLNDDGLTDDEQTMLEDVADEAIESPPLTSMTRGIGDDIEDMARNVSEGAEQWEYIIVGVMIRALQEKRKEETYPSEVRPSDYREIEEIAEEREDRILENQVGFG